MLKHIKVLSWILFPVIIFIIVSGFDKCSGNLPDNKPNTKSRIIKESSSVIDTVKTGIKDDLLCIYKLNAARIIASGNNGLIITSSNGGLNWEQRNSSDTMNFFAATMLNQRTYIVAGEKGRIRRSTDYGITWDTSVSAPAITIKAISFSDTLNGFAANGTSSILKTIDGGNTWNVIPTSAAGNLNSVSTPAAGFVIACGDGGIITSSTDGGTTWVNRSSGVVVNLNSIFMLNTAYGKIAGNSGTIITTSNGGANWLNDTTNTSADLKSITISSSNLIFSCGDSAILRKQSSGWVKLGIKEKFHSISIPIKYCSSICDGNIHIISSENCPCTHILDLTTDINENGDLIWKLSVTPDVNQNIRNTLRIEVGGNIERISSGWTEYADSFSPDFGEGDNYHPNWPITTGNRLNPSQTILSSINDFNVPLTDCDYLEIPINSIGSNDRRIVTFRLTSIIAGSNIPLYCNFLDNNGISCLNKVYILNP